MRVLEAGHAVVTDLGRFEGPALGFSVNGALDQGSARLANILVGNPESAPLIEITASALRLRLTRRAILALTGAEVDLRIDGQSHPTRTPLGIPGGAEVEIRPIGTGVRSYLAVHGSLEVETLLGSCAPDSMIGFGTRLTAGSELAQAVEAPRLQNPQLTVPLVRLGIPALPVPEEPVIDVTDGPDLAEFGDSAQLLLNAPFTVDPRSNHVGLRLTGEAPRRLRTDEVLSRGVPVGAVEVPSKSQLLVLHRGRGVTAGYPVLAVLTTGALDRIAQVRPGQQVRFRRVSVAQALRAHRRRALDLDAVRERVLDVLSELGLTTTPSPHPEAEGNTPVPITSRRSA